MGRGGSAPGPSGDPSAEATVRRADLDALRGVAMLLGVVLHATLSFSSLLGRPADRSVADPAPYDAIFFAIHGFRMPLFFLLSGYFTALLWRRRGLGRLLRQRSLRIVVPLLVGTVTVVPAMDAVVALTAGPSPDGPFSFHHLWFLWYLVLLTGGFVLVVALLGRRPLPEWAAAALRWTLPPLTLLPQLRMGGGGAFRTFGPDASPFLVPEAHHVAYFALFFAFGALAHGRRTRAGRPVIDAVGARGPLLLLLGAVLLVAGLRVTFDGGSWLVASVVQVAYAWTLTFALIGLFARLFRVERRALRYLADASYWIYLVHLPLVLWLQAVVAGWDLPAPGKFLGIIGVTTVVCVASYQLVVRHTPVGVVLDGPRRRAPAPV